MHFHISWKESLSKLLEGNMRFRMGLRSVESFASALKLRQFAENGQSPSAIILTCSDSRVPTEILFDKGVGDLFVIRVAGNVISRSIIASIEYAATVLKTPLCVVMGHTQCGAVRAAYSSLRQEASLATPNLDRLLEKITPAVRDTIKKYPHADEEALLQLSGIMNVQHQVDLIHKKSPELSGLVSQGHFRIIGALYSLHDGEVSFDVRDIPDLKVQTPLVGTAINRDLFNLNSSELL